MSQQEDRNISGFNRNGANYNPGFPSKVPFKPPTNKLPSEPKEKPKKDN